MEIIGLNGGIYMTNKSAKRVVIISDLKSNCIEQAIFILKDNDPSEFSTDIMEEANQIVYNYIRQVQAGQFGRDVPQKKKWLWWRGQH